MIAIRRTFTSQSHVGHKTVILMVLCVLLTSTGMIQPTLADAGLSPELKFSTYFGGNNTEYGQDIATDGDGNIYITGTRLSSDFPTATTIEAGIAPAPALFVSKFDPTGTTLLYSTVIGTGYAYGIAVDADGSAYVVGEGSHLPTVNAVQSTFGGGNADAFVVKLNPTGTALEFSTYLGGSGDDTGIAVAVDAAEHVYVVGSTLSANFPTQNAYDNSYAGGGLRDLFIAKFNASGSTLAYSTYYGGGKEDVGLDVVADDNGNVYLTGRTESVDFPVVNASQAASPVSCAGLTTCPNAFVAKLSSTGTPVYSMYLGGSGDSEVGGGIAIDNQGGVYVAGYTNSTDFPVKNAFQATPPSGTCAFVTKFKPDGSGLVYSTYLAGSLGDSTNTGSGIGVGIAVDAAGRATVVGQTVATDFPTVHPIQAQRAGTTHNVDLFVSTFSPDGRSLEFSTYLGGSASESFPDRMPHVAIDGRDNVLVVGNTQSDDFPILNAYQPQPGRIPNSNTIADDAFITKIALNPQSEPGQAAVRNYYFSTDTPTLTWTPITGATHYRVQVSQNKQFTGTPDFAGEVTRGELSITTDPLPNGVYYWHVQAQKPNGDWTTWSPVESFTIYAE